MEVGFGQIDIDNHFHDCACVRCLGHLPTSNEVVEVYRYISPRNVYSTSYYNQTMSGNFFEDAASAVRDFVAGAAEQVAALAHFVIGGIVKLIERAVLAVIKVIREIDWKAVGKFVGEGLGNFIVWFNPTHLAWEFLKNFPLTAHLAKQLDDLLGGALSTIDRLSTLTGRALRGDAISKGELLHDVLFCVKLAVAIVSGPVGWVSFAAGQLKQGTLGRTALGRDILSIIEVAGYAYVAGTALYDAAFDKSQELIMQNAQADLLRNMHTGDPTLDAFLVGATFVGAGAAYAGGSVYDSFLGFSGTFAENTAVTQLAERIGGPLGRDIATGVVKGVKNGEVDPSGFDYTAIPKGYSLNQFTEDLAKLGSSVKESFISFIQTDSGSFALPQFTIDIDIPNLKMPDSILLPSLPQVNLDMPSITAPRIEFPEISMPTFNWDIGDWDLGAGRKAKKRKTKVRGTNGKYYTVYLLGDNTLYYVEDANYLKWLLAGGAALLLAASV